MNLLDVAAAGVAAQERLEVDTDVGCEIALLTEILLDLPAGGLAYESIDVRSCGMTDNPEVARVGVDGVERTDIDQRGRRSDGEEAVAAQRVAERVAPRLLNVERECRDCHRSQGSRCDNTS